LGEEAVELAIAAVGESRAQVICESADLLYHLMVLWADTGVVPEDVWAELKLRSGTSGIAEKKGRSKNKSAVGTEEG
ncbi:MAG: phosphoribosyl-ATP diphosphatase, partial [Alphaproteobacteria bacterium]|nr:phosphoribosyl-ATP diphosphatase [Alphaproteobacteria bacterium]